MRRWCCSTPRTGLGRRWVQRGQWTLELATSSTIRDCEIFAKVWAYLTASIVEPVAFVNKKSSGVSRVVVFTVLGVQGVYDRYNLMFAIQVGRKERQYVCSLTSSFSVPQRGARGRGGEAAGGDGHCPQQVTPALSFKRTFAKISISQRRPLQGLSPH